MKCSILRFRVLHPPDHNRRNIGKERPPFKLMACTKILRAYTMDKVTKPNVMIPKYLYAFLKRVFHEWDAEPSPEWFIAEDAKKLSGAKIYVSQEGRSSSGFGETGGGLGGSRPIRGASANSNAITVWNPKARKVGQLPPVSHLDENLDKAEDGMTNRNRLVGTKCRVPAPGLANGRIFIWCVCANSKAETDSATYPGHWRPSHGPKDIRPSHPNALADGSCYTSPKRRLYLTPAPPSKKPGKRKADDSKVVTEDAIKLRKVMKMGQDIVDKHNKAVKKVHTTSLRLSKCETSHHTNQERLVKEIKKLRKECKNVKKKSTKALQGVMQHVKTFAGLVKKNEDVPFDLTVSFFGSLADASQDL